MAFLPADYIARFLQNPGQNDATKYGVSVLPATPIPNQPYYRVIGIHHLSGSENGGKNNIYLDVLDERGLRIGPPWPLVDWTWEGRQSHEKAGLVVLDKPDTEPGGNIALHAGQIVSVWIPGRPSDKVTGLQTAGIDDPGEEPGNHRYHHSFYVVWQRQQPQQPKPDLEPEPEPTPGPKPDWHLHFGVGELWLIEECRKRPGGPLEAVIAKMAGVLDALITDD